MLGRYTTSSTRRRSVTARYWPSLSVTRQVHDVFHEVQQEMVSLTTGVSEDDLAMAKAQLKYNLMLQVHSPHPRLHVGDSYSAGFPSHS